MTSSDRDAIRQRCERATKGEWFAHHVFGVHTVSTWRSPSTDNAAKNVCGPLADADAEFIAHAREDIPRLLEALATAEQQRAWQPIETAPRDVELFFWIVPKTTEEAWLDTSGNSIFTTHAPFMKRCKYGCWSSLSKAIYWMHLPSPPATGATPEDPR